VIAADDDRPRVKPLVDALVDRVDDATAALLVASPSAAASEEVDDELSAWMERHPAGSVLIVLIDGELRWDNATNAFAAASTALSPRSQRRFSTRPLWLDGREGVDGNLRTRVLAALEPAGAAVVEDAAPPSPATARRARSRWPLVVAVAAFIAGVVAVAVAVLVVSEESDTPPTTRPSVPTGAPPPTLPAEPSGSPGWALLAAGLAFGVAIGFAIAARRRPRAPSPARIEPPPGRATVFISHNVDSEHHLALRLAADLRSDADVWVAPESIAPGESWLTSVERGLGASRVFLALLSEAALASPWVLKEIQAAMDLEVRGMLRLVPVTVEDCEVPILLRTYQTLRLAPGYRQLVEQTRTLVRAPG
jgi:hypothetical protein